MSGCGEPPLPRGPRLADLPPLPAGEPAELPRGPERPLRELAIALTGEVRGEIDPCGCPTGPTGGFARREAKLEELRGEGTLLHLDAGELLLRGLSTARTANRAARAELLLELSRDVGVDAWTPGPTDLLALGIEALQALARGAGPPPVGASWRGPDGRPLLPPARVISRDGLKVGVIGVTRGGAGVPQELDPVEAATDGLAALPDGLDLVVVLGVLGDVDADRVAAQVPGVGLVLTTQGDALDDPRQPSPGGAWVIETPDRGRYVAHVELVLGSTADQPFVAAPDEQAWRDRRTARDQARQGHESAQGAAQEALFAETARGRNLLHVREIPLASDLDEVGSTSAVARAVARFKADTLVAAAARAAEPPPLEQAAFAASGVCVNCHSKEFARWTFTRHARAWETLLAGREDGNPECIPCHSTGFGEPGGWGEPTPVNLRKFKAVQCEACHGPLAGHADDPRVKARPVVPETCLTCHDAANSPDFDFPRYLPLATCQGP